MNKNIRKIVSFCARIIKYVGILVIIFGCYTLYNQVGKGKTLYSTKDDGFLKQLNQQGFIVLGCFIIGIAGVTGSSKSHKMQKTGDVLLPSFRLGQQCFYCSLQVWLFVYFDEVFEKNAEKQHISNRLMINQYQLINCFVLLSVNVMSKKKPLKNSILKYFKANQLLKMNHLKTMFKFKNVQILRMTNTELLLKCCNLQKICFLALDGVLLLHIIYSMTQMKESWWRILLHQIEELCGEQQQNPWFCSTGIGNIRLTVFFVVALCFNKEEKIDIYEAMDSYE